MPSLNKIQIIGHLGKDVEMKYLPNGTPKGTFSVATSRRWKNKATGDWEEATTWHNVVAWSQEWIAARLSKGSLVYVDGRIETRSYESRDGEKKYITEIVADTILPLNKDQGSGTPAVQSPEPISDDDIPF